MKHVSKTPSLFFYVSLAILLLVNSSKLYATDFKQYKVLANQTIEQAKTGTMANVDQYIEIQLKLIEIAKSACNEYISKVPESKKLMTMVVNNIDKMKSMTLKEIEHKWHEGNELASHGFTVQKDDHFGEISSLIDSVIHPVTALLALKEYKKQANEALLQQVVAELVEVLTHIEQIKTKH